MVVFRIKCVILGNCNAGKTSLLNRYLNNTYYDYSETTIGCSFNNKSIQKENDEYKIDIWDTAGQERYRALMPMYYRNSDLIFLCFDLSSETSIIKSFNYWIKEIDKNNNVENKILVIIGTKSDNKSNIIVNEINELIKNTNYHYFETSSKKNLNIKETFEKSFELVIQNFNKKNIISNEIKTLENNDGNIIDYLYYCNIL
jgi:small GTP-binding protein